MTLKYRSTDDASVARPPLQVITDPESARRAALESVKTWCGWCGAEVSSYGSTRHDCRVSDQVKRMHAEGARRELAALSRFPIGPCIECGKTDMEPGQSHLCKRSASQLPHDQAATQWARVDVQLAAEINDGKESQ